MKLDYVTALRFPSQDLEYSCRDSLLYALSLGFGEDATDLDELPFVFEGLADRPQLVVPTECVTLGWQPLWLDDSAAEIGWQYALHAEQRFTLSSPLRPQGRVHAEHRLTAIDDKGAGRGAILCVETQLRDLHTNEPLALLQGSRFLRADGGCGSWGEPPVDPLPIIPEDARPIARCSYRMSGQAALLYRVASRDLAALHADPAVAKKGGFDRPITHGMYLMGIACRAVLKTCLPGAPDRLRTMGVRFVGPGFPGETIEVEIFQDQSNALRFRARAIDRNAMLLDRGVCRFEQARDDASFPGRDS